MKTISISGFIEKKYSDMFETIKIIQDDGYKVDLVGRFKEAVESYPNLKLQVSYYLSDEVKSKSELVKGFIGKLYGSVDADYEKNDYRYSSWTSGTDYNTKLTVGGHNLFLELSNEEGKFILLELNFKK